MKKHNLKGIIKRVMAATLSTVVIGTSISTISASATRELYVDFYYDYTENAYYAKIMCNGLSASMAGFHVEFGSGWSIVKQSNGKPDTKAGDVTFESKALQTDRVGSHDRLFMAFAGSDYIDLTGCIISVKLTKTSSYSSSNATGNVVFEEGDFIYLEGMTEEEFKKANFSKYADVMLRADEYIVGDANGDGVIDSRDASKILQAYKTYGQLGVYSIRNTFKTYFSTAKCAAAPDANRNGIINQTDANLIQNYYAESQTNTPHTNKYIGKIDIYEIF